MCELNEDEYEDENCHPGCELNEDENEDENSGSATENSSVVTKMALR